MIPDKLLACGLKAWELAKVREEWSDFIKAEAENRVLNLAVEYGKYPSVFREAWGFASRGGNLSRKEAGHRLLAFCCHVVASEWTWSTLVEGDDIEVTLEAMPT
jgi:hypothetical protein